MGQQTSMHQRETSPMLSRTTPDRIAVSLVPFQLSPSLITSPYACDVPELPTPRPPSYSIPRCLAAACGQPRCDNWLSIDQDEFNCRPPHKYLPTPSTNIKQVFEYREDAWDAAARSNDPEYSLSAYRLSIALSPKSETTSEQQEREHASRTYHAMSRIQFSRHLLWDAIDYIQKALDLNPTHELLYERGVLLQHAAMLDDAIDSFREALSTKPDFIPALFHLGLLLSDGGDLKSAERYLNQLVAVVPDHIEASVLLSDVYEKLNHLDMSLAYLNRAIKLSPHDFSLRRRLAHLVNLRDSLVT